ncbi:MAG: metal-dependent hydrolase [Cytophagales bacterium CG18_big_fil_WC_8_21_14_2_50_42_9]|nr:MAG: metal-dependent hydrolase [Cytophagales bacterium CG18_big_fil_WC_8_21_14_2_50_42_9]
MNQNNLEVWLRGPLPNMPDLLQPVAHALLQAREEVNALLVDFPAELLWEKPAQVASVGFHLQHLTGVLDRLFTYARAEALTPEQLAALAKEGKPEAPVPSTINLVAAFNEQVNRALAELQLTDITTLTQFRSVGRAKLPSTQLGLYVHAAEHTQRHVGQMLVTIRILKALQQEKSKLL